MTVLLKSATRDDVVKCSGHVVEARVTWRYVLGMGSFLLGTYESEGESQFFGKSLRMRAVVFLVLDRSLKICRSICSEAQRDTWRKKIRVKLL